MTANDCEACTHCAGCGRAWCRDERTSPGDVDGICPDCFETEDAA